MHRKAGEIVRRQGFTLVELSIVLVIIGLLIGGILVGQSLIDSSKITAQVRQIQQLDIATNNFIRKYKALPGDSGKFDYPGNNDGILLDSTGIQSNYSGEIMNVWSHLTKTEMLNFYKHNNNDGITAYGAAITPGLNCPKAVIGERATILGMTSAGTIFPLNTPIWHIRRNFVEGAHLFDGNNTRGQSSPLTIMEAASVDNKMDDGNAIAGDVRASDGKRTGQQWASGATEQGCVLAADNSKYDINLTTVGASERPCGLVFKMQIAK